MITWLLLLAGCDPAVVRFPPDLWVWDDSGWRDSAGDTGPVEVPSGVVQVDAATVSWGCNRVDTAWTLTFRTTAWTGGARFDVFGPGPWSESHPVLLTDSSSTGAWDEYSVGPLLDGVSMDDQVPGSTSVFDCATDQDQTTQVIRLQDRFGATVDCVVWGADPAAAQSVLDDPAVVAIGGCRTISPDS